jgi:hypothetical protein
MKRYVGLLVLIILLFGFGNNINRNDFIVDVWWLKYNDRIIRAWNVLDTAEYNIETKNITSKDTIRFMFSADEISQGEHTTKIFLGSKGRRVEVSSKFSDTYGEGDGQFAASRAKKISDSLMDRKLEVQVFFDIPYVKPWVVATLRLK